MALPILHVIVPFYNEEPNVVRLFSSFDKLYEDLSNEFMVNMIIVDDGSKDNTVQLIEKTKTKFKYTLLKHETNIGPGAAFATAFSHLSKVISSEDWILTVEGDNTSDINAIRHMLVRRKEGYDVILGSPYLYGGGFSKVSFHRLLISNVANGLIKLVLGIRGIQTFSCFLRLYNTSIIQKLQAAYGLKIIECTGFECMAEFLAKLIHNKARISEVEFKVDWAKRAGKSKMKIMRTVKGYLRLMIYWKKTNG